MSIACNDQKSGFARWEVPESWESASLSEQVLEDRSQQTHVNIRLWPHHQSEIVPSDKRVCRTRMDDRESSDDIHITDRYQLTGLSMYLQRDVFSPAFLDLSGTNRYFAEACREITPASD
jgi:hypothetical protein